MARTLGVLCDRLVVEHEMPYAAIIDAAARTAAIRPPIVDSFALLRPTRVPHPLGAPAEQLAFWSPQTNNKSGWLIEAGRIDFWVGASSADLRAQGNFEITRTHMSSAPATALPTRVTVANIQ